MEKISHDDNHFMKRSKNQSDNINLWSALRDVLIASMNKGQFLLACGFFAFIIIVLKMPGDEVAKLVFQIIDELKNGSLVGYLLFGTTVMGWFLHSRWQRKIINKEMDRLSRMNLKQQEQLDRKSVKTSKKR